MLGTLTEKELLDYLLSHEQYKSYLEPIYNFPKPYCQNINNVKAIVLGADPSTRDGKEFEYVFDLGNNGDRRYFNNILKDLKSVGLQLEDLYVQNLCKNYFTVETAKNKFWHEIAECWVPFVRKELDALFDPNSPVFITAGKLRDVMCYNVARGRGYKANYENAEFIPPQANKLKRTLLPLYRNPFYSLKKWQDYKDKLCSINW